jgi:hypothetical protein
MPSYRLQKGNPQRLSGLIRRQGRYDSIVSARSLALFLRAFLNPRFPPIITRVSHDSSSTSAAHTKSISNAANNQGVIWMIGFSPNANSMLECFRSLRRAKQAELVKKGQKEHK